MKAHQFLFEKGYTQKVRYPDGQEEGTAFSYDTVIRLMTEYSEHLANGYESEQRQLTIPDVSGQSELLSDFLIWYKSTLNEFDECKASYVANEYIKSLNCR
jgi:hypothetical protein